MKRLLEKIKGWKGGVWALLLMACAAACLLLPGSGTARVSSSMTEEEIRISATLSRISGAGETRVSVYYAKTASAFGGTAQTPVGAVVVSKGAGDLEVRLNLMRAAQTLLGLGPDAVEVFSMEDAP